MNDIFIGILKCVVIAIIGIPIKIKIQKIWIKHTKTIVKNSEKHVNNGLSGSFQFDYSNNNGVYKIGSGRYEFDFKWSKASDKSIHAYNDAKNISAI